MTSESYVESAFTKSSDFAHENEYRFLFVLRNPGGIIAVENEPVLLDMKPIAALLDPPTDP